MNEKLTHEERGIVSAIVWISFVQMATNVISSVLPNISAAFPSVSIAVIQLLMTFPGLFIILFTVLANVLLRFFDKKRLIEMGLLLVCLSAVISYLGYRSLFVLFIGAGVLGCGVGLCSAFAISLISDHFSGEKKQRIIGWQTAASNMGSLLMTLLGGLLAMIGWNYNFLVYLIALVAVWFCHRYVPKGGKVQENVGVHDRKCHFTRRLSMLIIVFMVLFYIAPTSISLLLSQQGKESTVASSIGMSSFLLGGTLMSMMFFYVNRKLHRYCIVIGIALLGIGLFLMGHVQQVLFDLACFVSGASIGLVMPRCMLEISQNEPAERVTVATSIAMAASNFGILIAPLFTVICSDLLQIEQVSDRIETGAGICWMLAVICFMMIRRKKYG